MNDHAHHVEPDENTRGAEASEGRQSHTSDRPATSEEAAAAERRRTGAETDDLREVARHEKEMMDLGADIKGEGEIE